MSALMAALRAGGSLAGSCPAGCVPWAARYFGDCVCCAKDGVSFALGMASILCWGTAEMPQIIANFQRGRSEGVSLQFICMWLLGDSLNLAGCVLSTTLPTQLYTAVLYTAATVVLVLQHVYYEGFLCIPGRAAAAVREGAAPDGERGVLTPLLGPAAEGPGEDGPRGLAEPPRPAAVAALAQGGAAGGVPASAWSFEGRARRAGAGGPLSLEHASPRFLSFGAATRNGRASGEYARTPQTPPPAAAAASSGASPARRPLQCAGALLLLGAGGGLPGSGGGSGPRRALLALGAAGAPAAGMSREQVGVLLGWLMTAVYLAGRVPQILKNYQRGSVEGLSVVMFCLAIGGNATYLSSILVRSVAWEDIQSNLPWCVDAALCLLLDFIILAQYYWYTRAEAGKQ